MTRIFFFTLILATAFFAGCGFRSGNQAAGNAESPAPTPPLPSAPSPTPDSTPEETAGKSATLQCQSVNTGDYKVYKKQTFAIDFEPFRNSCFVTSHSPEYEDPPMESQIAIYKGGKKVFDFPSQFNGVNFGCWVEAAAFQDLNEDKLTDVIVVSKCQAKSDSYNENTVYVNTGKSLTTRDDANISLSDKRSVKEVADFVKENRTMFFN